DLRRAGDDRRLHHPGADRRRPGERPRQAHPSGARYGQGSARRGGASGTVEERVMPDAVPTIDLPAGQAGAGPAGAPEAGTREIGARAVGEAVPILGQGTWGMGEAPGRRAAETAAL